MTGSHKDRIVTALKASPLKAPIVALRDGIREIPVWRQLLQARSRKGCKRIAFLPSAGREMASLLRVYEIAEALPADEWAPLVVPWTLKLAQRQRLLRNFAPDAVIVQKSRHELNLPEYYDAWPVIYDIDDADFFLPHLTNRVTQAVATADTVIAGSGFVAEWCRKLNPDTEIVWTGTPVTAGTRTPQSRRGPIVAWAQSTPLSYVRETQWILRVMREVAAKHPEVVLRLYGRAPDQGMNLLQDFRDNGITVEWLPYMDYKAFLASLDDVAVGLSPVCVDNQFSQGKSFGKILAYLDMKIPVVTSDEVDHSLFFSGKTGIVSNDPDVWVTETIRLLEDPELRQRMVDKAYAAFLDELSIEAAARKYARIFTRVIGSNGRRDRPEHRETA